MKPTIYDVAERAGVSIATVSKVINDKADVGQKTKKRILKIIEEVGYHPSMVASALTGKHTHTIGLVIPDIANPFFAELARSVEDTGHANGYSVVICNTDNDPEKEVQYLWWLNQKKVDGVVLGTGMHNMEALKEFMEQNIPVVLVSRDIPTLAVSTVLVDDFRGGYLAAQHLLGLNHRKVLLLVGDLDNSSEQNRLRGFYAGFEEAGLSKKNVKIIEELMTTQQAGNAVLETLKKDINVSAAFALTDFLAIGCIQGARETGKSVPEDFSVIGFDDTFIAVLSHPPLTTISQPIVEMGEIVTQTLVDQIKGKKQSNRTIILTPEIKVRQTTAENKMSLQEPVQ
ncbi:LacI family DNA-binding transcriptional regulator [Marinococcus sp. PL1-022]|uniref:LacI family DNA-binding transcriptional regulator n=1 Tax=Marinococcus sp. PL1-022 TaxID=3095363 RepID=UPI0029C21847|nr:LacI family DNA-binding transcriptional regulator [Marinococcus sp. PL1-022]MDX6153210.1 LacI family DNA-binding transcriptional regulator [Marinococcus sp. PL1-022]